MIFPLQTRGRREISPDGKTVAYVLTTVNFSENKSMSNIWLRRPMERHRDSSRHRPRKTGILAGAQMESTSSSSRTARTAISFGSSTSAGARPGNLPPSRRTPGNGSIWSSDGKWIAFVSAVYPEYSSRPYSESNSLNQTRIDEIAKNPVKARVFNRLFFRHWDD